MTSNEIQKMIDAYGNYGLRAFWLREIALQLAIMNERATNADKLQSERRQDPELSDIRNSADTPGSDQ